MVDTRTMVPLKASKGFYGLEHAGGIILDDAGLGMLLGPVRGSIKLRACRQGGGWRKKGEQKDIEA